MRKLEGCDRAGRISVAQCDKQILVDVPQQPDLGGGHARLAGIIKSPLSRGILTGKFQEDHQFSDNDVRSGMSLSEGLGGERMQLLDALRDVLTANGHTLAQASLAYIWALDENMVPIPGFKSAAQVKENIKAMELGPLSAEQMSTIKQITEQITSAAYSGSTM